MNRGPYEWRTLWVADPMNGGPVGRGEWGGSRSVSYWSSDISSIASIDSKSTESIEEDWIFFFCCSSFLEYGWDCVCFCDVFDFVGLAETDGWVVLVTLDGLDSDKCLEDGSVCDNLDVEGFCVLDLVVRFVVISSKCEGRISAPASVCTALDTVFFVATEAYVTWVFGLIRLRASVKVNCKCI